MSYDPISSRAYDYFVVYCLYTIEISSCLRLKNLRILFNSIIVNFRNVALGFEIPFTPLQFSCKAISYENREALANAFEAI